MERRLKERLTGASVLVLLAVIFIPMVLDDSQEPDSMITKTNIPEKPNGEFSSRLIPLPQPEDIIPPEPETEPVITPIEDTGVQVAPIPIVPDDSPESVIVVDNSRDESPLIAPDEIPLVAPANTETVAPVQVIHDSSNDKKGLTAWVVQVGSFAIEENANKLNDKLRTAGYRSFVQPVKNRNSLSYRVRVGPEILRSEALKQKSKLQEKMKLEGIVLDYP